MIQVQTSIVQKPIIALLGPSGVGKSAVLERLLQLFPNEYDAATILTTRPLRVGETTKRQVTTNTFFALWRAQKLILPNQAYGNWYAPSYDSISQIIHAHKAPVLDWPAYKWTQLQVELRRKKEQTRSIAIYIRPPSTEIYVSRLMQRNADVSQERLTKGIEELATWTAKHCEKHHIHCVTNQTIDQTVLDIHNIITGEISNLNHNSQSTGGEQMNKQTANLPKPKIDKYAKARGGFAYFLEIGCAACNTPTLRYQKDGTGQLLRMYLNRIVWPDELVALQTKPYTTKNEIPNLACTKCKQVLAVPMLYDDGRFAYRVIPAKITKHRL